MTNKHYKIYLIPGLFGFGDLGGLSYFQHVQPTMEKMLKERGVNCKVYVVKTVPTGSIRRRSIQLRNEILADFENDGAGPIFLVGHSTGGLDARLLVTPGVCLDDCPMELRLAEWVRAVITLNCPHRGTPIASFFTTLYGKRMLYLLSLIAVAVVGGKPGHLVASALTMVSRFDEFLGWDMLSLDAVTERILKGFNPETQKIIRDFLQGITKDQGAVLQLTPEAMDLFNAAVTDHPDVEYLSYATAAPTPGISPLLRCLTSPGSAAYYFIYRFMYALVGRNSSSYPLPEPDDEMKKIFRRGLGYVPQYKASDGVVPTLSMPWGKLVMAQPADHLDVVGHFDPGIEFRKRHFDWLPSGSNFKVPAFESLWGSIADNIANLALEGQYSRVDVPIDLLSVGQSRQPVPQLGVQDENITSSSITD